MWYCMCGNLVHCCFFEHARRELLGLCKRACVPSDEFCTEGTWEGSLGIASSANYEQCLVPLENCSTDAALPYGITSRHANASHHCQITMRLLLNLNLLW